jgi:hypothetical protein
LLPPLRAPPQTSQVPEHWPRQLSLLVAHSADHIRNGPIRFPCLRSFHCSSTLIERTICQSFGTKSWEERDCTLTIPEERATHLCTTCEASNLPRLGVTASWMQAAMENMLQVCLSLKRFRSWLLQDSLNSTYPIKQEVGL